MLLAEGGERRRGRETDGALKKENLKWRINIQSEGISFTSMFKPLTVPRKGYRSVMQTESERLYLTRFVLRVTL